MTSPSIPGYQILEQSGGTNDTIIWKALQISLERSVSIWVLKPQAASDANLREHFESIIRAVAKIKHPNFAQIIDISQTHDGLPYIIFENSDCEPLSKMIKEKGRLTPEEAFKIAREVAAGLDAAWRQGGFLHRNLKPENILVSPDNKVKITNYNSSTIIVPGEDPFKYDGGMMVGTPNYASPEQADFRPDLDFRSDMYGLGAVLYQAVTGIIPFNDISDPVLVLELQRSGTITNPRTIDRNIKEPFVRVISRLMAKFPEDRYQSWSDAIEDFDRVIAGKPPFTLPGQNQDPASTIAPVQGYRLSSLSTPYNAETDKQNRVEDGVVSSKTYAVPAESSAGKTDQSKNNSLGSRFSKVVKLRIRRPSENLGTKRTHRPFSPSFPLSLFMFTVFCAAVITAGYQTFKRIGLPDDGAAINTDVIEKTTKPASDADKRLSAAVQKSHGIPSADNRDDAGGASEGQTDRQTDTAETQRHAGGPQPAHNTHPAPPALPDSNLSPQETLMKDIFNAFQKMDVENAKHYASKRFNDSKTLPGIDLNECKLVWNTLKLAQSDIKLVGTALIQKNLNDFVPVKYDGRKLLVKPQIYINGVLSVREKLESGETRQIKLDLTKIKPEDRYDILLATADSSNTMLVSRAILAMKLGKKGDVVLTMNRLPQLKPFLKFINN